MSLDKDVLNSIRAAGSKGLTADEASEYLDRNISGVSARITALATSGAIISSGEQRKTRNGRWATVWIVEQVGASALKKLVFEMWEALPKKKQQLFGPRVVKLLKL